MSTGDANTAHKSIENLEVQHLLHDIYEQSIISQMKRKNNVPSLNSIALHLPFDMEKRTRKSIDV
jgi:hypothetical protein